MVTTTSIIVNLFWRNIKINRIAGLVTFQILLCFVFWASCSVQSVQASEMSPKSALVFLAAGAEEMEVVITVDTLRRAKIDVTVAGVSESLVKCSRDVVIKADVELLSVSDKTFDAVIVPGGAKGAETLSKDATVGKILKKHFDGKKIVAAICAGPTAFLGHNIGSGMKVTSYPSFQSKMKEGGYSVLNDRVVVDSNLITSQGPGTAFEFAFAIVEALESDTKTVDSLTSGMLVKV